MSFASIARSHHIICVTLEMARRDIISSEKIADLMIIVCLLQTNRVSDVAKWQSTFNSTFPSVLHIHTLSTSYGAIFFRLLSSSIFHQLQSIFIAIQLRASRLSLVIGSTESDKTVMNLCHDLISVNWNVTKDRKQLGRRQIRNGNKCIWFGLQPWPDIISIVQWTNGYG